MKFVRPITKVNGLPRPAQDIDDIFRALFNLVNLLDGVVELINDIDLLQDNKKGPQGM